MANTFISIKSIDDKNLRRRLKRITNNIDKKGMATVKDIAMLVQTRAAQMAPKDTGKLRQFITVTPVNKKGVKEATVGYPNMGFGQGNPHPDRHFKEGGEFSLPFWMQPTKRKADAPRANAHKWTTGRRDFLFEAAKMTKREFENRIVRVVQDEIKIK